MNTKGLLNNTDITLSKRIVVERYFTFLSENIEIFSPNGKYFEGVHVRYVDPKIEEKTDYEVKDTDEEVEVLKTSEVLKNTLEFLRAVNQIRNDRFESDTLSFNVFGVSVYEISCSKFNLGYGYISPYIYTLDIGVDMENGGTNGNFNLVSIPFIIVNSNETMKLMVLPFANKLASYRKEYKPRLFDLSSAIISEMVNYISGEMSTNDWLFLKMSAKIHKDRYVFRNNDERLRRVLQALNFDTRLLNVEISNEFHYPDMPVVRNSRENPNEIDDILVTDLISFDSKKYEDYINGDTKAVVIRYPNLNGDVYIGEIFLEDDTVALNSTIYKQGTNIELQDDKLVESKIYEPFSENETLLNGVVRYISYDPNYGAYGEDDDNFEENDSSEENVSVPEIKVDSNDLRHLEKINKSKVDVLRGFMKKGNKMIHDMSREKNKMLHAKYVNEFLRGISEAIFSAIVTGGLVIFLAPYMAIVGGIITFIVRMMAKRMVDKREYALVKKGIEREISYFEEKRENYQDNPEVVSRIDKILSRYQKDLETLEATRRKKERQWEEEDAKKNIEGDI
nr:MAG TPA: hypothetical protein [Caudoviricetes sp.]